MTKIKGKIESAKRHERLTSRKPTKKVVYSNESSDSQIDEESDDDCAPSTSNKKRSAGTNKPFKCSKCGKSYASKISLIGHEFTHTGNYPFACEQCPKSFPLLASLKYHKLSQHNGVKSHICETCSMAFLLKRQLFEHERTHSGVKTFKCEHCNKLFMTKSGLITHLRTHTGEKPYKCGICSKGFGNTGHLQRHFRIHTGERPYKCDVCHKGFQCPEHLKEHAAMHSDDRPFHCSTPGCPAKYKTSRNVSRHERACRAGALQKSIRAVIPEEVGGRSTFRPTQLAEKMAKRIEMLNQMGECPVCHKMMKNRAMTRHIETHTYTKGFQTFTCAECNKNFSSKSGLKTHLETHDDNRRVYECKLCDKTFLSPKGYKTHFRVDHTEDGGRTKCPTCGIMTSKLSAHIKMHTLPYFCEQCFKRFARGYRLKEHQRYFKEGLILECQYCDKTFNSKNCLEYHKTTHDSDGDTSASENENQLLDSDEGDSLSISCSGATGFTDCFIQVKRADFIESAIEEGYTSIRITRLCSNSNTTLYTPIP